MAVIQDFNAYPASETSNSNIYESNEYLFSTGTF